MAKDKAPAPSSDVSNPMLTALVAQFLENNGYNSAHRVLNTERKKRPHKQQSEKAFAKNYTAGFPPLETIFHTWQQQRSKEGSSSSDDDEEEEESAATTSTASTSSASDEECSSSSSEDEMSVDIPRAIIPPTVDSSTTKSLKRKAPGTPSSSDSSSSDTSDSDSGKDAPLAKKPRVEVGNKKATSVSSSASTSDSESSIDASSESDSSSSSSDSDSGSDSDSSSASGSRSSTSLSKKTLQRAINTNLPSSSDSSSSDSDSSDSDSAASAIEDAKSKHVPGVDHAASDSSGTIIGDLKAPQSDSDSSTSEEAVEVTQVVLTKKKHVGAQPTRLATLSADADMQDYVSNNYVSYDYADKAYRDLSITRGKGFTKEKNKKKRGSYRGGAIDISGGKGFKFSD